MNSNSLLKVYGVNGYRVIGTVGKGNETVIKIGRKHMKICCCKCGNMGTSSVGRRIRDISGVPSGLRKTILRVSVRRFKCRRCGHVWQESVPFAKGNRRYSQPSLKGARNIGIDGFSVRRGVEYRTIAVDLDTGRVIHAGKGRDGEAPVPFRRRVRTHGVRIRCVAADMPEAFIASVLTDVPEATPVSGHFHVVRLMNGASDGISRSQLRHERNIMRRRVLMGTRYLLLRNAEDILDGKYRTRPGNVLAMNEPLSKAYYLKESLRRIWMQPDKGTAENELYAWVEQARSAKVPELAGMAATVMAHRTGILAWYDGHFSTAKVEGINNKIKVLKRNAYGFRDEKYFKLRLFALHDATIHLNCG